MNNIKLLHLFELFFLNNFLTNTFPRAAYRSKKTSEVARAYFVLSLCGVKPLVKHNAKVGFYQSRQ